MFYAAVFGGLTLIRLVRVSRGQFYWPVLIGLFLFSAFRFEVGCDWSGYLNQFDLQQYTSFADALSDREPLWWMIIEAQHKFGLPYPWLNVISSFIFFAGVHVLARRQPDPLSFLVMLFPILIINMPMSGIRQGAAIGIMCMAFAAFFDKSMLRFAGLTLLASTIHSSAICFLLLSPLVAGGFTWRRLLSSAILAIPGALVLLSGESASLAASRYVDTGIDAAGAAYRVALLGLTGVFYFILVRKKWASSFPADYSLVSVGALAMIGLAAVLPVSSVIADRMGYYFIPIQAMIFARLPFLPFRNHRHILIAAPYIGLFTVFAVWAVFSALFAQCYLPYQTWLLGFPGSGYDW